nr:transposase [Marinisporobacter balticus]
MHSTIEFFFKENKIGSLLRQSNVLKLKGSSCLFIFKILFYLVFTGKNLFRILQSQKDHFPFAKDVIYRFLQSTSYNWRKFLLLLSSNIIINRIQSLTSEERVNVLIVDDSLYDRSRSKSVELLARVHDHTDNRYKKGFRMLTLGWSDGNTFLPLAFTLLSSHKASNRLCSENPNIDKRSNGYKIRKHAVLKSPAAMMNLIRQAKSFGIPAKYVLFDSWFTYPRILMELLTENLHTIAMVKAMPKVYYTYKDKQMNLKTLYSNVKKKRGKAKILASVIVQIGTDEFKNPIQAKIVFVRDRNRSRKWLALISTDLELEAEEIIRIYGKRWDIEVFFKMTKSFLRLSKEFQCRSYDALVAHTTIVFTRYIMLALEKRKNEDFRTLGNIFYYCCDELDDIHFACALQLIIDILKDALQDKLFLSKQQISEFIDFFISRLPDFFKEKMVFLSCES